MVEYLMLITLGACGASLIWLGLWPALARRAERLARRRVEAALPMSVAEFAGERDQLRAGLAVKEALVEKRANTLAVEKASMLAEAGRLRARVAELEEGLAGEVRRHAESVAEKESNAKEAAAASAALAAERLEHGATRERLQTKEAAERELTIAYQGMTDAAEQRRLEAAALQAEREALLGRLESLESAHQSLRAEHGDLAETAEAHRAENSVLKAERETHLGRFAYLDSQLGMREARLAELDDQLAGRTIEKNRAELEAKELKTRLDAGDAHAARQALELEEAKERLASLKTLHQTASRQAVVASTQVQALRQELAMIEQRGDAHDDTQRKAIAKLKDELGSMAKALETERVAHSAAAAALAEARTERDRLQADLARLGARRDGAPAIDGGEQRLELVGMIEHLADEIARVTGADPLPPPGTPAQSAKATEQAAAAE